MATSDQTTRQKLQRQVDRRQVAADDATAALAHGSRRAHRLYALLAELEDQLERDHPRLVATLLGAWATHDADQIASHQRSTAIACVYCQAAREQTTVTAPHARTA
jgi:hypothetical protein